MQKTTIIHFPCTFSMASLSRIRHRAVRNADANLSGEPRKRAVTQMQVIVIIFWGPVARGRPSARDPRRFEVNIQLMNGFSGETWTPSLDINQIDLAG